MCMVQEKSKAQVELSSLIAVVHKQGANKHQLEHSKKTVDTLSSIMSDLSLSLFAPPQKEGNLYKRGKEKKL